MQETWVSIPGSGRSLEKGMAGEPTPGFLPGESPWTEEPGRLQSMGSHRVGHDWVTKHWGELYRRICISYMQVCVCVHTRFICSVMANFLDPVDYSLPGSSVYGLFQARILEWIATYYSRGSFQPRDWNHFSSVSCIGRQILYCCTTWEAPRKQTYPLPKGKGKGN